MRGSLSPRVIESLAVFDVMAICGRAKGKRARDEESVHIRAMSGIPKRF